MADQAQLERALRRAHAAGDVEAAKRLARAIKASRAAPAAAAESAPQAPRSADDPTLYAGGKVPSIDPTEGVSGVRRFGAGVGKSLRDTALGTAQFLASGGPYAPLMDMARENAAPRDVRSLIAGQPQRNPLDVAGRAEEWANGRVAANAPADAALMDTGAGLAGNIVGQVAQVYALPGVRAGGLLGKLGNAAGQGAVYAGAQPVMEGQSRATNAATGAAFGAAGQGVASGLGALAQRAQLPQLVRDSISSARAAGIPLNVAQTTTSAPIRAAQAVSKYLPFSGAGRVAQRQQQAFNRAAARSFGADAPVLSDDVMKQAQRRLSDEFNDIYARNDVAITPDVARRLLAIEREAAEDMVPEQARVVRNQVERIVREASEGSMTGDKYQAVRTALQKAEGGDPNIARMVKKVRAELDEAAVASVGPDDAARLAKVRGQWANLRTVQDVLKQVGGPTGQGSAAGNLNPAALWPAIRRGSTKEMRELAKIGQNVLKEGIADSGTGPRTLYQHLLTAGATAGGGTALGLSLGTLGKGAAVGALAGRALNSNTASKLLQQGRPMSGLARLAQPLPKALPALAPAGLDLGLVTGYDPTDPRYQGN
jgi:hypothetical protein